MAVKVFSKKDGQKPFLNDWLDSQEDLQTGMTFFVKKITMSVKGLMVHAEDFIIFLFKSDSRYDDLMEFVSRAVTEPELLPTLVIVLEDIYGGYAIGLDDEVLIEYKRVDKKTFLLKSEGKEDTYSNPLMDGLREYQSKKRKKK